MIELFTIFGKGGLVLWCFNEGAQLFTDSINTLIKEVILQERGDVTHFKHNDMTIKFKLDNEFHLVFIVVYQSMIQLSYADKLITDVSIRFRDMYKNVLENRNLVYINGVKNFKGFTAEFDKILTLNMRSSLTESQVVRQPKTYQESAKSQKTVESMILNRPGQEKKAEGKKKATTKQKPQASPLETKNSSEEGVESSPGSPRLDGDEMERKKKALFAKLARKGKLTPGEKKSSPMEEPKKKGKEARVWALQGGKKDTEVLDYSSKETPQEHENGKENSEDNKFVSEQRDFVGRSAALEDLASTDDEAEDNEEQIAAKATSGGWFSAFKDLVGNKKLTVEDIEPALEKMKENLITKNVAAEPADKICQSVAMKLDGKVIGTFSRVNSEVKEAVKEALTQLLTPRRRVDILRDIVEAKKERRPYVVVFCGVNGVGKSTNLAKITFWLNENGHRVLIAAGDTFRAGAVEQLRTHTKHLNALHPNSVQLYEQGYGKDPAGLAAAAIAIAVEREIDVVLVDTAGRMQDNEPLMRALAKLIRVNEPDLCLFVGEALVGNEAVDQLVKFNQALADHTVPGEKPHLIDGIVLTKFDTIDDKVGAAISMTYITGQPIVFVGCGQTYKDLRNLNANSVVAALLK